MGSFDEINEAVDIYIKNETLLSQYYSLCITLFIDHAADFTELSRQEKEHAEFFKDIKKSVLVNPNNWYMGTINIKAAIVMGEEIRLKMEEILSDSVNPQRVISFITDIEHSLVETQFHKAFITNDPEFTNKLSRVMKETLAHQDKLREILLKMNSA